MIFITGFAVNTSKHSDVYDGQPWRGMLHISISATADRSSVWWQKITSSHPQTISAAATWGERLWAICSGLRC